MFILESTKRLTAEATLEQTFERLNRGSNEWTVYENDLVTFRNVNVLERDRENRVEQRRDTPSFDDRAAPEFPIRSKTIA